MGWIHDAWYLPAREHEGGIEPAADPGAAATGWRVACTCGWRSETVRADRPAPGSAEEGSARAEWRGHVEAAVPELHLRTLAGRAATSTAAVEAEVRVLRMRGVSWERIGAATGTACQSAWEKWRHLDPAERERVGADARSPEEAFLPALQELKALASPHLLCQDVDPAVAAVENAAIGLRRLLAPAGPEDTDDAVARLDRAADYARAVHADMVDDVQAFTDALAEETADPDLISVERATVAAYDPATDDTHVLDVRWEGGLNRPTTLRIGDRALTDPIEIQRVAHALAVLAEAAANTVHPE
ncbi:hypothetical protein [Nocardiopsis changdeensis]|uniref:hypothetical protein n=1 Tax=Nocardiopsis changdeensis TaxID=2831969 RepID=UPI003F47FA40